jgi:hypothetical protein
MTRSRLMDLYHTLSKKERKKFAEYLESPFFNKNLRLKQALGIISIENAPEDLDKKALFSQLFGQEQYNELKLNNLLSDLLALLYDFLAYQQYENEKALQQSFLVQNLLQREWMDACPQLLDKYAQTQARQDWRDSHFYYAEYQLQDLQDQYGMTLEKRQYTPHLQARDAALDHFYHLEKLKIACDMTSRNTVVNADYTCRFLPEILEHYTQSKEERANFLALDVYLCTYAMLQSGENEHYQQLKYLLQQNLQRIPQQELRLLYSYCLNHAVRKINSGETAYYQEILSLYRLLLEESIIFKNGGLTQWTYINIVTAGIRTGNYQWTEGFIQQYEQYLLPELRNNVSSFSLANLFFEKGDYAGALRSLHNVEFTDAFYHLSAKLIQLKSYYLLAETEALGALLNATRRYLQRNRQLSAYQKKSALHFLQLLQRMAQMRYHPLEIRDKNAARQGFERDMKTLLPLANKQWLEEQFEQCP